MYVPSKVFKIPRVTEVIKNTCEYLRYREGKLWYRIQWYAEPDVFPVHLDPAKWEVWEMHIFEFPIAVDDAGAGDFEPEMKAITLMRWIRKHIDFLNAAKEAQDGG